MTALVSGEFNMSFSNNSNTSQVIKNYILDGNFVNGDVQAYTGYNDGASATPTDGTGGTNTTFVRSLESGSPIEGTYSIDLIKSAGNQQGNGVSIPFTIDSGDKGKVLLVSFNYKVLSGTFATNDVDVYLYDITNATIIQPSPFHITTTAAASDSFIGLFTASATSTSYRLIFHCASTSTSAYTLTLDNIFVGVPTKLNNTVTARYNSSTTSLSTTQATIVYTSKDYDTHSAYSTSTGKFTVPMSGKYRVTGYLYVTASWTAGQAITSAIRKNGTSVGQDIQRIDTTASAARSFKVVDTVNCVTGDTLEFALASEGTTPSISASTLQNYIVIERVGN